MIRTRTISFSTNGYNHIIDLSDKIREELKESGLQEGQITVFAVGSTTGITTLEYEPGLVNKDVDEALGKIAPYGKPYEHNKTWGDDNGASHIRSAIVGTSMAFPFQQGELLTGTWQQVVFIDFDTRNRERKVVLQFMGE